jgi:hypothetical protein
VHVATSGVTFDRATGNAQTVAPVKFDFPNGNGDGVGAVYASEEGHLRLIKDVHLKLRPAPENTAAKPEKPRKPGATVTEVGVNGSSLEFDRNTGIIQLHGPVTADTAAQRLTCGELVLTLDEQFRSQTLIASPGTLKQEPQVTTRGASGENTLTADKLTTRFAPHRGCGRKCARDVGERVAAGRKWKVGDVAATERGQADNDARKRAGHYA